MNATVVVDASVAVKWFLPEANAAAAQHLLASGDRLVGPSLIRVEVAAALARKVRLKELAAKDAEDAAKLWARSVGDGVITLFSEEAYLHRAFDLAIELHHPLQDCVYLALAERLSAPLITADQRFAARARAKHPAVRLLDEI